VTAADAAVGNELVVGFDCRRRWEGKPDAIVGASRGGYLGVDADDLAREVYEGPAGVSRIDCRIGLEESLERCRAALVIAIPCAEDARGTRLFKAEGRTDPQHPVAHRQLVGIAHAGDRQNSIGLYFYNRQIGGCVDADHFSVALGAVAQAHTNSRCPLY